MNPWKYPPQVDGYTLLAKKGILEMALKENNALRYFLSYRTYTVHSRSHWDTWGDYQEVENPAIAVLGAYDYYREHPESKLDKLMYNIFDYILSSGKYTGVVNLRIIDMICVCLYYQERGKAPFEIDCESLIKNITIWGWERTPRLCTTKTGWRMREILKIPIRS